MRLILILLIVVLSNLKLYGQDSDSCQCRLVYGNWFSPTLVSYHHDSLVTFTHSKYPKEEVYRLNKQNNKKDTIYGLDMYKWHELGSTFIIKDGDIGRIFNNQFYPEFPKRLMDSGQVIKSFWTERSFWSDTITMLYGRKTLFERPSEINSQTCNCFNQLDYFYDNINYKELDLHELDSLKFTDFDNNTDSNLFVPTDSRCYFGFEKFKTCYLKGIGTILLTEPYPNRTEIKIIYLTKACEKFLKNKFKGD